MIDYDVDEDNYYYMSSILIAKHLSYYYDDYILYYVDVDNDGGDIQIDIEPRGRSRGLLGIGFLGL